MLNKTILLLLLISLVFYECSRSHFPTMLETGSLLENYKNELDEKRRVDIIKGLLTWISNPKNASDDNILRGTMEKLTDIYLQNHDEAILIAVDETGIDGGFANFVCEFYRSISSEDPFKKRYQRLSKPLERCVGISFNENEIGNLIK